MPHILVVDDDDDIRIWLETVLETKGYEVTGVASPKTVVRQLLGGDVDLVMIDYHMPEQDGLSLLRELHSMHITTPSIMLTFDASQGVAVECFRNGAVDFISKPIDPDYLGIIVERALSGYASSLKNMAYRTLGYVQHKEGCSYFENLQTCTCGLRSVIETIQDF